LWAVVLAVASCTAADGEFQLSPGDFTLAVTSFDNGMGILIVEQDGSFRGSPTGSWAECASTLTADEFALLADALSRADVLHAVDRTDALCDAPWYEIAVSVVEGSWAGGENRFRVDTCNLDDGLTDITKDIVPEILARAGLQGSCTAGLYCDSCEVDDDCRSIPDAVCTERYCCDVQQMMCTPDICRTTGWPGL